MTAVVESVTQFQDAVSVTAHGPVTLPAGTAAGDLLLAFCVGFGTLGNTWADEAGWTTVGHQQHDSDEDTAVFWKIAGASEGNPTFDSGSSSMVATILLIRISGAAAVSSVNISGSARRDVANPTSPSVTTTVADCLVIVHLSDGWAEADGATIPAGTTAIGTGFVAGNQAQRCAHFTQATAGATGTKQWTSNFSNNEYAAWTVAIAPGASGVDIAAPSKAFTRTGNAPAIAAGKNVAVPSKAFALSGQAPAVGTGARVLAPSKAFTRAGFAPQIGSGINVSSPAKAFTRTGNAPAIAAGKNVAAPAKAYTLSGQAPTVTTGATVVNAPSKAYAITGNAPTIATGVSIAVPVKNFVLTAFAPIFGRIAASIRRLAFVLAELRTAFVQRPVGETDVRTAIADPESRTATVAAEDRSAIV